MSWRVKKQASSKLLLSIAKNEEKKRASDVVEVELHRELELLLIFISFVPTRSLVVLCACCLACVVFTLLISSLSHVQPRAGSVLPGLRRERERRGALVEVGLAHSKAFRVEKEKHCSFCSFWRVLKIKVENLLNFQRKL